MTRSSHTGELLFDPEIEKATRRLRQKVKLQQRETTISSPGLNIVLDLTDSSTESEREEEKMANPERTLRELAAPDLTQQPLCIQYPELNVSFELKSGLIHLLPNFHGLENEDPHKHLKEFYVFYSSMRPQRVTEEQIKFRVFLFSLKDRVKG